MSEQAIKSPEDRKKHSVDERVRRDAKPHLSQELKDEKADIAAQQKEITARRKAVKQRELWGVYDENPQPNREEGEITYDEYIQSRPIVKEGDYYFTADKHHFASKEAYEAQFSEEEGHDWSLEYKTPYEGRGVAVLAKEMAAAKQRNDRTAQEDILRALDSYLTDVALNDDSETAEQAQKRYQDDTARFEELVERFENLHGVARGHEPTEPGKIAVKTEVEAPSAADEVPSEEQPDEQEALIDESMDVNEAMVPEQEVEPDDESTMQALYEGEPVLVQDSFTNPEGKRLYEIRTEAGDVRYVAEADLSMMPEKVEEEAPEIADDFATELEAELSDTSTTVPEAMAWEESNLVSSSFDDAPHEEVEAAETAAKEAEVAQAAEEAKAEKEREEASKLVKFKDWMKGKGYAAYLATSGLVYWAGGKFESSKKGAGDFILNVGTNKEGLSEDDKEKIRSRNRRNLQIGAAALVVVSAALIVDAFDFSDTPSGGEVASPAPEANLDAAPPTFLPDFDTVTEGYTPDAEELLAPIPQPEVPAEVFDIPSGGGIEAVFNDLGVDTSNLYGHEAELANRFPQDLQRTSEGLRVIAPGPLSNELQDYLLSLRR